LPLPYPLTYGTQRSWVIFNLGRAPGAAVLPLAGGASTQKKGYRSKLRHRASMYSPVLLLSATAPPPHPPLRHRAAAGPSTLPVLLSTTDDPRHRSRATHAGAIHHGFILAPASDAAPAR
jgi:hypothetical protein